MTPALFAQALVARLTSILPPGFEASADGGVIHLDAPDGVGSASTSLGYLDPDEAEAQDYADAAWNVLSMAQDVVSETTTDPWPVALGSGLALAEPGTRVDALWAGEEGLSGDTAAGLIPLSSHSHETFDVTFNGLLSGQTLRRNLNFSRHHQIVEQEYFTFYALSSMI